MLSIVDEIAVLGRELNANQYRLVRLAAEYDSGLEWHRQGYKSASMVIAQTLDIDPSTACEWIRVGHALDVLPLIRDAFASNGLSYAKARILTRRADEGNEQDLLDLAAGRPANRLTVAVTKFLAGDETDEERDERHHQDRGMSVSTDADGMVVIRLVLAPAIGKQVVAGVDSLVKRVAATPRHQPSVEPIVEASADASRPLRVVEDVTDSDGGASADASQPSAAPSLRELASSGELSMVDRISELERCWYPAGVDDFGFPSLRQQRADAFTLLFLEKDVEVATEVVIHVRGDGASFDDGTPITESAVCRRLGESFIRVMVHDENREPIDASNRRRYPTTRQKRVVLEAYGHECVDCQRVELLEFDHNPPFEQTQHTVTSELEPRCAPCHRARHRNDYAVPVGA